VLVIAVNGVQYNNNPPPVRGYEGFMEELVARLVANVGVDQATAEKSIGIILDFLHKEGPADKLEAQQAADTGGGFGMGGLMGAGTKLMAAGLSMGQVQGVTKEVMAFSREKAGEDVVGEIVGSIPGLSQFI